MKGYDYSLKGYYFSTVCSKDRQNIFGEYKNVVGAGLASARNNIKLSPIGKIIEHQWNDIPNQFENVDIEKFVIMPNHIHGILIIHNREDANPSPTISLIIRSFKSSALQLVGKFIRYNSRMLDLDTH